MNTNSESKNPFIAQTALDYSMSYNADKEVYDKYGSTPLFYEKLEEIIKERSNQ